MTPPHHPITALLLVLLLSIGSGPVSGAPESVPTIPDSPDTFRYTVQPGDSAWNITARYLRTTDHWKALRLRHQLQGDLLRPGQVLQIPMDWLKLSTAQATLTGLAGAVQVKQGTGDWQPARLGTVLPPDTRLRTPASGTATLRLQDGTQVLVRPDSELRLMPLDQADLARWLKTQPQAQTAGATLVRIELLRGGLENAVQPQKGGNRFEVHTPSAVTTVRGTEFRVFASTDTSRAEVVHGAVDFHNPLGQVDLGTGTGSRAARGVPPVAAVPLLPAPDLSPLPDPLTAEQARQTALPAVAGAQAYRSQWFSPGTPGHLLHEAVGATLQPEVAALPDGTYRWRVRAIDTHGFEGLSAERTVTLAARPVPPPPLQPPTLQAARTGPRLELRWRPTDARASVQVQVARDARFDHVVLDEPSPHTRLSLPLPVPWPLAMPYHARIRAVHPDGRASAWSAPLLIDPRSLQETSP